MSALTSPGWAPALEGDPAAGEPARVRGLAREHRDLADDLEDRQAHAHHAHALLADQHGKTVQALRDRTSKLVRVFGQVAEASRQTATVLDAYADRLDELTVLAARARYDAELATETAQRARFAVMAAGGAAGSAGWWDPGPSTFAGTGDQWAQQQWTRALADFDDARARFAALVARREDLDQDTVARLGAQDARTDLGFGTSGTPSAAGLAGLVGVLTGDPSLVTAEGLEALDDPKTVRKVWDSLSPADRARLLADGHQVLGNLDGIPLAVRARANRANIEDEIARLNAELVSLLPGAAVVPTSDLGALVSAKARARYEDLATTIGYYQGLLDATTTYYDSHGNTRSRTGSAVVTFDPSMHAIAIYHGAFDAAGDIPAWVKNVGVFVPGTGTKMTDFGGPDDRASYLYEDASGGTATSKGAPTSMVVWSGGFQPQFLDAAVPKYSEDLGPKLAAFVNSTPVPAGADVTVLGHSYGGTTVAEAEKAGLRADRILYVSSAGLGHGVDTIAGFPNTKDVPHYALMARDDGIVGPIQGVEGFSLGHGTSPLGAHGVTRLETGYLDTGHPNKGMVDDLKPTESHSGVFSENSTSWNNIVSVITGGTVLPYAPDKVEAIANTVVTVDGDTQPGWDDPDRWIQVE